MIDLAAAAGKMHITTQRMVAKHPFHANLVATGVFVPEPVRTMAVTVRDGLLTFLYDPAFVLATELDVLIGSLLHETGHVLADHLTANPANYPDRRARTIAEEVTVNEWIIEPLPPGVLRIDQFGLVPDEDTDTRYERLRDPKSGSVPNSGRRVPKKGTRGNKKTGRGRDSTPPIETFDDHSFWDATRNDPIRTRQVIDQVVVAAADRLGPDEGRSMSKGEHQRVRDARGRIPRCAASDEIDGGVGRVRWQPILERLVGRRREAVANFRRPSRRFPSFVGIVPAFFHRTARLRVCAVVDTSGSMDARTLAVINGELAVLARLHDVTVVQCDDRVRSVAPFTGQIARIIGRGNTDFRPPLERVFLADQGAEVVVYFCDGQGPAPVRAPRVPVIWAITAAGRRPAAWGHMISLPAASAARAS
ncbi:MAG: VWA-like domain-containing protein [Thermoanaerobaculia bacterium]